MRNMALVVMVALLAGVLSAALSVDAYTVTPSILKPGEEGAVTFSVKNVLPSSATSTIDPLEDVQVYFGATTPGLEFKAKSPFTIGTIESGGSALVSIPFRVLPTAKGGVITSSFFISQKDQTDLKTVNAIIKVVNPPILTLSSDRQTLLSTDNIKLTIKNDGGAASKVSLKIDESSDFAFIGTTQVFVGDVDGSVTVDVPIDARNVEEGINQIPFILSYQQEGGDTVNESKKLSIAVNKEKVDLVFTQQQPVVTSQDNTLLLKVKNTGRALKDVNFYLEDDSLKAKESKLFKIGDLATGEEKIVSMLVFADATPGVRNTEVRLTWIEDDVQKEQTTAVQIFVNSDADAAIFVDAKPAPIVVGGEHTLAILVSNVGSYKILNVEVSLGDNDAFELLNAQKSQYIGGLESDDFSTVQYKVRVKATQPGTYTLPINIRYKDQSGEWVEKKVSSQIAIRPASDAQGASANGSPLPMLIVAVLLAGGAIWWFKFRKTEKHPKKI